MFKKLENSFKKRQELFQKAGTKTSDISGAVNLFLEKEFGDNLKGFFFTLSLDTKENSLTISTQNKIIANELMLRLADLSDFLKNRSILLSKIIIR